MPCPLLKFQVASSRVRSGSLQTAIDLSRNFNETA
jgi:hypothetical protein